MVAIGNETLKVRVLVEDYELEQGLMYRKSFAVDSGFLFQFPKPSIYPFWMKNTEIPLAIAFIDSENNIIAIDTMMPFDTSLVIPPTRIIMALETNIEWYECHHIRPGMELKILKAK